MNRLLRLFVVVSSALFLSSGCTPGPKVAPAKTSNHVWGGGGGTTYSEPKEGVSGLLVTQDLTCDDRLYFVMRCSASPFAQNIGTTSKSGANAEGTFSFQPGNRQIAWSCVTEDGKNGKVLIDGQPFDLAKGAIFLVTMKDSKTTVEQVAVDMAKLEGGMVDQKLWALGEAEPRIAAFLKSSRGEK